MITDVACSDFTSGKRRSSCPTLSSSVIILGSVPVAGAASVVVANRTRATADALVAAFADARVTACEYGEVGAVFDVVVNATSASLAGELAPVPPVAFGAGTLAYDLMYAAAPTPFMVFAASHGAQVRDGLGMLVEQAAEAFAVWRGVRPDTAPMFSLLRQPA